jgi:diguanylate cyclase (GGDEF)-like protein
MADDHGGQGRRWAGDAFRLDALRHHPAQGGAGRNPASGFLRSLDRLAQSPSAARPPARRHDHQRPPWRQGALLFIDLDNFKTLNDTLGHEMGDLLLQQVAKRLSDCVRDRDTVARLGGDEFVVMLENLGPQAQDAATQSRIVGEKILDVLNRPYDLAGSEYHNTPSVGITLFGGQQVGIDELMKRADLAMYEAKATGRNTLRFFDPQMQAVVTARRRSRKICAKR